MGGLITQQKVGNSEERTTRGRKDAAVIRWWGTWSALCLVGEFRLLDRAQPVITNKYTIHLHFQQLKKLSVSSGMFIEIL